MLLRWCWMLALYSGVADCMACCQLALLFVVGCVADGWRSYGSVVDDMACCKFALLFVVGCVAGVADGVAGCWCSCS